MNDATRAEMDEVRLRLAAMAEQIGVISREIAAGAGSETGRPEARETILQVAERLYAERRRRGKHFRETLFCDPAWDILLDLFIATERGRDISVTSACLAAGVPSTTGLRWLHILEDEGLVISEPDAHDGRRRFIRLTRDAMARMRACLAEEMRVSHEPGGLERVSC
ncbi:MAG: MarR family transcriptional regulator [Sphingomonadales bacterium]|nr:MarR family transcriptional regulator [Sphingomonadales bacterium]